MIDFIEKVNGWIQRGDRLGFSRNRNDEMVSGINSVKVAYGTQSIVNSFII